MELTRDEVKAMAGEVLADLGVEPTDWDEGEREAVARALEAWRRAKREGADEGI